MRSRWTTPCTPARACDPRAESAPRRKTDQAITVSSLATQFKWSLRLAAVRTFVSPSGKVEVKWPSILGGGWKIIVGDLEWMHGFRWPGKRRSRWLIWGLDAIPQVLRMRPAKPALADEIEQLSKVVGKPTPDSKPLGYLKGIPPIDAALDRAKELGWSETK